MRRISALLVPFLTLLLLEALFYVNPTWLEMMRLKGFDALHAQYPRVYDADSPVKIIDIDEESLRRFGQWPWPRNIMAQVMRKLYEGNVAAVGLDMVFAEPDRSSPALFLRQWQQNTPQWRELMEHAADFDQMFAEALAEGPSVTGFVLSDEVDSIPVLKKQFTVIGNDPASSLYNYKGAVVSLPGLTEAATGNGAFNSMPDNDGIIRRIPLVFASDGVIYPSLISELLRVAQGAADNPQIKTVGAGGATGENASSDVANITAVRIGQFKLQTNPEGDFYVHYTPYKADRYIPVWKLLSGEYDISQLEGQIVLIGTSAAGLKDIRATPLNPLANGVEVHAQAIEQVIAGDFLSRPDWLVGVEKIGLLAFGVLLIVCMSFASALGGAVYCVVLLVGSLFGAAYAFQHYHLLLDATMPAIGLLLLYMLESLRRYIITERERREIRHAFVHYMSPALVEELAKNPQALKLGGETRDMTILFSDIRGFTTLSEMYSAEELTRFLNRYLTPMTDVILKHRGTIDKYMGDAIMAFWNAPLDEPEHAQLSCRAALEMLTAKDALNARREAEAKEAGASFLPVQIGIGLNSGECCVGNMGSDQRFDYSVLGDDVNLASRLEGQSKNYGVSIILGENTYAKVTGFATLEIDLIRVKGKTEAVRIYTLLGDESLAAMPAFSALEQAHATLLTAYRAQRWEEALALATAAEKAAKQAGLSLDGLYDLYRERIADYKETPPQQDWDGVYVATSK